METSVPLEEAPQKGAGRHGRKELATQETIFREPFSGYILRTESGCILVSSAELALAFLPSQARCEQKGRECSARVGHAAEQGTERCEEGVPSV